MSHENNLLINQSELATEYGRYIEAKTKKGFFRFFIKALVIPFLILLVILAGATFIIANTSPSTYALAKNIVFSEINVEKFTGLPDSVARERLDSWLVLNTEQPQAAGSIVRNEPSLEATAQEEPVQQEQVEYSPN